MENGIYQANKRPGSAIANFNTDLLHNCWLTAFGSREDGFNASGQAARLNRLDDVVINPGLESLSLFLDTLFRGQHQNGDTTRCGVGPKRSDHGHAIHARHVAIRHDDSRFFMLGGF
jgi:hypothetical protein